ncbi:hypothetical protein SAMN03159496_06078 [Rhizobium sp. NFR07]|nr:hypothetical protein SAMN03159496_06078 [Rhizobium sp. NFR07]
MGRQWRLGIASTNEEAPEAHTRPDVTQRGLDMIGDFRTDALHEALARAPIEDDMLIALLVLSLAGDNVRMDCGAKAGIPAGARFARHAARLLSEEGGLCFDMDTVRITAREALIDVNSCRRGISNSDVVALIAGNAIGADAYLPTWVRTSSCFACPSGARSCVARCRYRTTNACAGNTVSACRSFRDGCKPRPCVRAVFSRMKGRCRFPAPSRTRCNRERRG